MIPLVHDLGDETVLIFGGGPVGARRARRFAGAARVVVLAPTFADEEFGDAALVRAAPDPEGVGTWIERAAPALAVAATDDPAVNDAVVAAARDAGALANRADREGGDVVVPAILRDGPVVVGVSTGGGSPAVAGELRRRIEASIEGAGALAAVAAELREDLRERGISPETRRDAMRALARSERAWAAAREGREAARETAVAVVEEALSDRQ